MSAVLEPSLRKFALCYLLCTKISGFPDGENFKIKKSIRIQKHSIRFELCFCNANVLWNKKKKIHTPLLLASAVLISNYCCCKWYQCLLCNFQCPKNSRSAAIGLPLFFRLQAPRGGAVSRGSWPGLLHSAVAKHFFCAQQVWQFYACKTWHSLQSDRTTAQKKEKGHTETLAELWSTGRGAYESPVFQCWNFSRQMRTAAVRSHCTTCGNKLWF